MVVPKGKTAIFSLINQKKIPMSEDIKKVYTGNRIEALFIREMLEESGIDVIVKDRLASSVKAGWADGPLGDTVIIFVESKFKAKADELVSEYLSKVESGEIDFDDKD